MQDAPVISYVITVYNKAPYVGFTAESLFTQEGHLPSEFIFVDDASTDQSVSVIEAAANGMPNVTIVRNTSNVGPSIRLNQGVKLARGKYLQFIDSDDIMAANASLTMLNLIEKNDADVIYGRWDKTGKSSKELLGTRIDDDASYLVSDSPMQFWFEQRILRMTQMVRRDTFTASGGCDEGVFIQDESIALRLVRVAKRFILLDAPVVLVPTVEGELSRNVAQLNHDRFLALRNMILDFPDMDDQVRRKLYRHCVSAVWKQKRYETGMPSALFSPEFLRYMWSRYVLPPINANALKQMSDYFAQRKGVRRIA